jgi:hypothetical protein
MSGIEVAGIVLAAMPLVISGLEHYGQGVCTMKRLWKFKRELQSLVRQLTTEQGIFMNTCEALLTGLVPLDSASQFLQSPGGQLWQDPEMEAKLVDRLRGSYAGYVETVSSMCEALEEFKRRLKLDKTGKVSVNLLSYPFLPL